MSLIYKIKFHPFFYFVTIVIIITGQFKNYLLFMSLILVHEVGHITGALILKWNIEKIIILPFGGLTIFNEKINRLMIEEFIILIMGPLFQIIYYQLFKDYLIKEYHYLLLLFNLLPIYPLDGSKLLNLLLNKFISFKASHIISIIISIITILFVLKLSNSLINILIVLLLIINVSKEIINHKTLFYHFILERYLYHFNFKKIHKINGQKINKMRRDKRHMFYFENKCHTEREIINKKFDITI